MGYPPLFIGDVTLAAGTGVLLLMTRGWRAIFNTPHVWLLVLLVTWGAARTAPYVSRYGADALRDSAIFAYSAFAIITFAFLVTDPSRLRTLIDRYRIFTSIFVMLIPWIWLLSRFAGPSLPRWPWADVPVVHAKGGDILVHLSGTFALAVAGLSSTSFLRMLLLTAAVLMIGAFNRGGMVSFAAAFAACLLLKPQARPLWRMAGMAVFIVVVLAVTDLRVTIPGSPKEREVSFSQLMNNVSSVAGTSDSAELSGTKQWRLNWWGDIINYTINGPYLWTGKGFGINLADDDGYQGTAWEGKLRSPHNGHMTMLARAGLPGFALWILVQLSWIIAMLNRMYQARAAGEQQWASLLLFLIVYWVAFIANTSFDVFVEGPMGGVWFWTVYGVGLATMWAYKHRREVLGESAGRARGS